MARAEVSAEPGAGLWSVERADEAPVCARFPADRRAFLLLAQRFADAVVVPLVWLVANSLAGVRLDQPDAILAIFALLLIPYGFSAAGLYTRTDRGLADEAVRILGGWALTLGALLVAGAATRSIDVFPRDAILLWAAVTPVVVVVVHAVLWAGYLAWMKREPVTAVVVGGHGLRRVTRGLASAGVRVAGVFEDGRAFRSAAPVLGGAGEVVPFVRRERVPLVFVSLPPNDPHLPRLLDGLRDTTASIYYVPAGAGAAAGGSPIADGELDGQPIHALVETPFADPGAWIVKRVSDYVIGAALLLAALPLMAVVALAIRLTSRGPVLFRQRRHGLDGREIVIYKFRTMTVLEDGERVEQARHNDPRVTRLGAFLRRTSLDELPQLVNVLQGRMSVVGPRPHAVAHNEHYRTLIPGYMRRHKVKPGITGWAQVHGLRGGTDTESMRRRIEHDLYYLHHWSLWLDLRILAKTVLIVLGQKSAY